MRRDYLLALGAMAFIFLLPSPAEAYLGPGGVITAIGAMLALLAAIVFGLAGFLWYPLKRFMIFVRSLGRSRGVDTSTSAAEVPGE